MKLARFPLLLLLLSVTLLAGCAIGLPDGTTAQQQGYALEQSQHWGYD